MAATAGREGGGGIVDAVSVWCVCVFVCVCVCVRMCLHMYVVCTHLSHAVAMTRARSPRLSDK